MAAVELAYCLIFLRLSVLDGLCLIDNDGIERLMDIVVEMEAEHVVADQGELRL